MELKNLPERYNGYQVEDLLMVWQEIRSKEGTKAPREKIKTMHNFLREYNLGLFAVVRKQSEVVNNHQKMNHAKTIHDENEKLINMKVGYKKAIEILFTEYEKLKSQNSNQDDIKSIREGIEYLCYPFREDLTKVIRSPLHDSDNDSLHLDKADRSTPEKEDAFLENMAELSKRDLEVTLYALDILKRL